MKMLESALELVDAGWSLFPCRPRGERAKQPYTLHGHLEASQDVETIRSWWSRWPDAMIGAPVPPSLVVLDIDPRNGGSYESLTDALGPLPPTLTAWSGRGDGGRHLYYERPSGDLSGRLVPDGVDLKANGYCILPPSVHPATGEPYRWDDVQVAALPALAASRLRRAPVPRAPAASVWDQFSDGEPLISFLDRFPVQGINNALFWAACRAVESGVIDNIADDLISRAVQLGESEHRARGTVASARNKVGGAR